MPNNIRALPQGVDLVDNPKLERGRLVLEHAHKSARELLALFDKVRQARGARGGATTYEEQDLLRAMLVLAAAGLDSLIKQVIRDALVDLVAVDEKVGEGLLTFVGRQLRFSEDAGASNASAKFLAGLLVAPDRRQAVLMQYIGDMTGRSLQSPDEVMKAVYGLGLVPLECGVDPRALKPIFETRNQIIHELDINFASRNRRRHSRTRDVMISHANALLEIGGQILVGVDNKLRNGVTPPATRLQRPTLARRR